MTRLQRIKTFFIDAACLLFFLVVFVRPFAEHTQAPAPKIVQVEHEKAIRCIPEDPATTCVMKREGHYLVTEKHTDLTDSQRLVLMKMHDPIKN